MAIFNSSIYLDSYRGYNGKFPGYKGCDGEPCGIIANGVKW